jgi:predicted HTH transcriptional regulator
VTGTTKKTAMRDLLDLKKKDIVEQQGIRGPGVHYIFSSKRVRTGTLETWFSFLRMGS